MDEQGNLFGDDFVEYDKKFPEIWRSFKNVTFRTIDRGFKNYSAKGIFEVIRWETGVKTNGQDGFSLNNNFTPYYARKFENEFPQHKDFFYKRKSKFDK